MSELPPRRKKKKRRSARSSKTPSNRKQEASAVEQETRTPVADPLGKLFEKHEVTLRAVLVVFAVLVVIGGVVFGWGLLQEQMNRTALTAVIIGGFIGLMAFALLAINLFNVGRSLELRKRGIRFQERGEIREMLWSEIAHVEVDRLDATNVGVATTIHSDSGETILLSSIFFRMVHDPKKLISNIKVRSGR